MLRVRELSRVSPGAAGVHCLMGRTDSDAGFETTDYY